MLTAAPYSEKMHRLRQIDRLRWALIALFALALILRVARIGIDLPYIAHWDEPVNLGVSQRVFTSGDLNPHFFNYPSLSIYIHAAGMIPVYIAGALTGTFSAPADLPTVITQAGGITYAPLPSLFIVARLIAAAASLLALWLIYRCGALLTGHAAGGLLAGLLFAVSPNVIEYSDWANPNIYAVLLALVVLWAAYQIQADDHPKYYVIGGLAVGLAAAAKYNAALAGVLSVVAHFLRPGTGLVRGWFDGGLWTAGWCALGGFLLGTPYALLDPDGFMDGIAYEARHYSTGHAGWETALFYIRYPLENQPGVTLLALGALGWGMLKRNRPLLITASFPVVYFGFINRYVVQNQQTFLLMEPFLYLLAAWALWQMLPYAIRAGRAPRVAVALAAAFAVGWPLWIAVGEIRAEFIRETHREAVREWIESQAEPGARIYVQAYGPFIDPTRFNVRTNDYRPEHFLYFDYHRIDYVIFASRSYGRYFRDPTRYPDEVAAYEKIFDSYQLLAQFNGPDSEFRIYGGDVNWAAARGDS